MCFGKFARSVVVLLVLYVIVAQHSAVTSFCHWNVNGVQCEAEHSGFSLRNTKWVREETGQLKCLNGIPVSYNCLCHFGYTGVTCDIPLLNSKDGGSGSGEEDPQTDGSGMLNSMDGEIGSGLGSGLVEENEQTGGSGMLTSGHGEDGSGLESSSAEEDLQTVGSGFPTDYGYSGEGSGFETGNHEWSATPMDNLPWELISKHDRAKTRLVDKDDIWEDKFVVITTGIKRKSTAIHVSPDVKSRKPGSLIYRFTYIPDIEGKKSRIEINTCFTQYQDILAKHNHIPKEIDYLLKTSCPISNLPLENIHTHEYELYIPRKDFNVEGKYILTQWHGSPDPTILQDEVGCVAQVSISDIYKLCSLGSCAQGTVLDQKKNYIGIRYNQGGYPPLAFGLRDGYFYINARSDEMLFLRKGGCSRPGRCDEHPRIYNQIIWRIPAENFSFDQWTKFKWEIKWSEYSTVSNNFTNGGKRMSDAWIRVWMNGEKIVDWIGPCGRNDLGRVPYFKAGIYNPSGSTEKIRFFFRRYLHRHIPMKAHKDEEVRKNEDKLKMCANEAKNINQNAFKRAKYYRFLQTSSSSDQKCTLFSKVDHLAYLRRAKLERMLVDDTTKNIIMKIIFALDDQAKLIKNLQEKLIQCEQKNSNGAG